jgi:hypothetical protein
MKYAGREGDATPEGRYGRLAQGAGRLLKTAPEFIRAALSWLPSPTLDAAFEDNHTWTWFLFDAAWQKRHVLLNADRYTWIATLDESGNCKGFYNYPYDRDDLHHLFTHHKGGCLFPKGWLDSLPSYYYSTMLDVFQASVYCIDLIEQLAGEQDTVKAAVGLPVGGPTTDPEPADQLKRLHAKPKNAGGRPCVSEPEARKREELIGRWNRAKAKGVRQKDFCGDEDVSLKYLTKCVNWRAQRRRRNES